MTEVMGIVIHNISPTIHFEEENNWERKKEKKK